MHEWGGKTGREEGTDLKEREIICRSKRSHYREKAL